MAKSIRNVSINGRPYRLDERRKECRSLSDDSSDRIPFDHVRINEYKYWHDKLQILADHRIVNADMAYDDAGWFPVLELENGTLVWLLSDDEGNGPGRIQIQQP